MSVKIKEYHGHPLKSAEIREGRVPTVRWRPKVRYMWSAGVAMSRFLNELKKGRIAATRCDKCGRVMVPPRIFCEQCFKPVDHWTYVKDSGTINTYSVSFIAGDASRIKEPIIVAIIDLDGASPGMGILHKLGEINWKEVKFGMKVKAVWKPPEERQGAITDIKYFKPM
jgi:hypothetical protein